MAFGDLPKEPQACIGGARFIVTGPGIAEASLTVRDDFQGQGIGTELLRLLIVEAQKAGVRTLAADAQASNQSVFRMLRRLGLAGRAAPMPARLTSKSTWAKSAWMRPSVKTTTRRQNCPPDCKQGHLVKADEACYPTP